MEYSYLPKNEHENFDFDTAAVFPIAHRLKTESLYIDYLNLSGINRDQCCQSFNKILCYLPQILKQLGYVYVNSLNLSNNHLDGSIPKEILKWKDLRSLCLSGNNFDASSASTLEAAGWCETNPGYWEKLGLGTFA